MDKSQPYPGEGPESREFGSRGGFVGHAPPGSAAPPPWPVQHGPWPPFQPPVPPVGPSTYPHPHLPPPLPSPLPFDPSRPPPGYFGGPQSGPWPPSASGGQQPPIPGMGQFDQGVPFTSYGPPQPQPPSHQSRFQPISPGLHFPADHHGPPHHFPLAGEVQNKQNSSSTPAVPVDEDAKQRLQDEQWLSAFLQRRKTPQPAAAPPQTHPKLSVFHFRQELHGAVRALSELVLLCQKLKDNLENESVWGESYRQATELRSGLQERLATLRDPQFISGVRKKLELIKKKRARRRRRREERAEEKQEEERRAAEREAAIDKFQMKQIQELEEKNRERELKLAADAVLSEVRKKQADAKRMTDILKALEKLRKLRKEAASRKGMFPEKECDEVFEGHLTRLRSLIKKRTAVYGVEEKALKVMLEGEQEEERKRDREKRLKKEREKLLLKKQEITNMLFGAELPSDHPLQLFQEYYTHAERSLPALIHIRREWDQFLVPVDHPDGTSIPQSWVLPDPPADDVWATALEK